MQLDLKELAATLAIGAFFFFGVEFIFLNFFGRGPMTKIFQDFDKSVHQYVIGAVIITLCFIFGMVIEDASNKFVDDDTWLVTAELLHSDENIKYNVFFEKQISLSETEEFRDAVRKSVFVQKACKNNLFKDLGNDDENKFVEYLKKLKNPDYQATFAEYLNSDETTARDKLKNVAKNFYYNAKNAVYRNQTYYDELKKIQLRIDFSRAMVAVASFLMTIIILVAGFKILLNLVISIASSLDDRSVIYKQLYKFRKNLFATPVLRWRRLLIAGLLLCSIFGLALFAYSTEEGEFNKRTFGYYISLTVDPTPNTKTEPATLKCNTEEKGDVKTQ